MKAMPRFFALPYSAIAATCIVGCGSASGDGHPTSDAGTETAAADPFAGTFSCMNSYMLTYTSPPGVPATNATLDETLLVVNNVDGTYTASDVSDAGFPCVLKYKYSGDAATLIGGQSCTYTGPKATLTYSYSNGSSSASGSTVNGDYAGHFTGSVNVATDAGMTVMVPASGSLSGHFVCNKQ